MKKTSLFLKCAYTFVLLSLVSACAHMQPRQQDNGDMARVSMAPQADPNKDYSDRVPPMLDTGGHKTILVDPNTHAWGAYDADGRLVRAGIATAGGPVCPPDAASEKDCHTGTGVFKITDMEGAGCYSKKYPRPNGGGLMPYCMFFNNGQALHGSPDNIVVEDNISHGCVRMRIPDAEWMQTQFAQIGTRVVVRPY